MHTGYYQREDMKMVPNRQGVMIRVCPECIGHKQDAPFNVLDCKNLYIWGKDKDGNSIIGQCMCYSEEHGKRD